MKRTVLFALALAAAGAADAQSATRADPRDPAAPVERPAYRSAFDGYRPFEEQEPADWRKANDEVHAVGGHAGLHAAQSTATPPAKPEPKKPAGHGAHHR